MKRVVSLILVLTLLATLGLTGCTKDVPDDTSGETTKTEDAKPAETEKTEEAEELNLRVVIGGNGIQQDHEIVMAEANKLLAEKLPNTTFEMEVYPFNEYADKFDLLMAAQETVDVAWNCWTQPLRDVVNKGALLPLNDLIDENAPAIREEIPEWLLAGGLVEDELYMIPKYEMHYWQLAMYSPQAAFEKYFDIEKAKEVFNADTEYITATPEMYDVLEDYMAKAKAGGDLGKGFSPWLFRLNDGKDLIGGPPSWSYLMPANAKYYNPGNEWNFTVSNVYENPEVIEMFKKYAEWREKGYILEEMLSMENPRAEIENADADGGLIWFHNYMNPKQEGDYYIEEGRWDNPGVRFPVQQYPRVNANYNDGMTIPATAQDPVRSIKFLELLETEKGKDFYNMLAFGVEGTHYNKINENRIETTVGAPDHRSLEATYGQAKWVLGNCHNAFVTELDPVDDYKSYWDMMHKTGFVEPFGSFKYDDTNTVNEITQIKTVVGEYTRAFMCGYYTEEKYTEFLEKLDKAGVDKVIEDVQQQLDAYLEAQGIPKTGYVID